MNITFMKYESNHTDYGGLSYLRQNLGTLLPFLSLTCCFILCGCIGNVMVIGAVLVYKPLRTVGNMFVVNLALTDLGVTGIVNPFNVVGILRGEEWFKDRPLLCTMIGITCIEFCFGSLLSILLVSIDRYVHICQNKIYYDIFRKRTATAMCICVWICAFAVQVPLHFGLGGYGYDRKFFACMHNRLHPSPYISIVNGGLVLIPIVTILICYYKIFTYVKMCKAMISNISKNSSEKDNSFQLVKTSCIIFAVFAICWSPFSYLGIFDRGDKTPLPIYLYACLLAHMNSFANPIIYGLTNKQFRIGYKKLLGIKEYRKSPDKTSYSDSSTSNTASSRAVSTFKLQK